MSRTPFGSPDWRFSTSLTGAALINTPLLNKGTAFTEEERDRFKLHGILPPHIGTLESQAARRLKVMRDFATPFERYTFLRDLLDTNETLFYRVLVDNLEELMPLVYTPTVGEGCERFSEIWRKPRGLFLSYPNRSRLRDILADPQLDRVRVIVVSDGERILGLGDQGAGGMGIPIGKLSLYTGCAGIHPSETLPILLDVGTDNAERLADPLYVGWRHARVRGADYDAFVEDFVAAVVERWPDVLLQWEDFAGQNSGRFLERFRDRLCTFNDDIQGTAAVAAASLMAAVKVTGGRLRDQRIVLLGAGSAGCGIANLLLEAMRAEGADAAEARSRFYAVDMNGLLIEGIEGIRPAQRNFVQPRAVVEGWGGWTGGRVDLATVIGHAKPTVLIGVSGQAGAFTEPMIRTMAQHAARPIIFPLSNPTSRAEATPQNLADWTDGRALIGTGSPFPPVRRDGQERPVDQTNNSYIFPGVGLGVLVAGALRITDGMFMAAARRLASLSPALADPNGRLLPPIDRMRDTAFQVALAVAEQAHQDGVAPAIDGATLADKVTSSMWDPVYSHLEQLQSDFIRPA